MSNYGITPEGFITKRLVDIKAEIEAAFRQSFGESINLLPESVIGQFIAIMSERESLVWELSEGVYNSLYPETAEGAALDNVVSLTGITRQPGVKSSATLSLFGDVGAVVPAGTSFSVEGSATSVFTLEQDVTLTPGNDSTWVITFDTIPDAGEFTLKYKGVETYPIPYSASAGDLKLALETLSSLKFPVQVAGNFPSGFTIIGESGDLWLDLTVDNNFLVSGVDDVEITLVNQFLGLANGRVLVEATEIGPVSAPSGSLTVIDNPVSGLDTVTNLEDASLGRLVETDADLKARRASSLQRAGAGTLGAIVSNIADLEGVLSTVGFENTAIVTIDGRPGKSIEIVVLGGDDQEIGEKLYEVKPGGIQVIGDIELDIIDSQGFPKKVYISRPIEVPIHVELDLTVDPANFPVNGLAVAKQNVLDFGNALGVGEDVIVIPQLISSLNNITGILDIAVRIGTSANPTLDDNIPIAADQISDWDSGRISVQLG